MNTDAHAHANHARMPPADGLWDTENSDALMHALAGAAARVDHAMEQHLRDYFPQTCGQSGAYIADWARILGLPRPGQSEEWNAADNEGKAAMIRAALAQAGDPNITNLGSVARALFGEDATLSQGEHPPFLCGASGAGDGVGGDWSSVWTLRYMPNVLGDLDDFSAWDSSAHVADASQSPRTLDATADQLTGTADVPTGLDEIHKDLTDVTDGDHLRLSVWFRSADTIKDFRIALLDRNGDLQLSDTVNAKPDLWQKLALLVDAGAGATTPQMWVLWDGGDMFLSYAVAGVRAPGREVSMTLAAPVNTQGEFLVVDE